MKKQSILILTPGFPADEGDTTCIPFLQQFCASLDQVSPGIDILVFAFQYPFVARDYQWHGIRVFSFGGHNKKGAARILLWMNIMYRFLLERRKHNITGIFSIWLTECAMIGKALSSFLPLEHYTWVVGQDARSSNRYVKVIRPDEKKLIAISPFISSQIKENFNLKPAHIISNGISPGLFPPLKTVQRTISVITVSSLIPLKNLPFFIEIIGIVAKSVPMSRVLIIGDGPEKESLKNLVRSKGLDGLIGMTGGLPHAEVLKLMSDSRILLHTSGYEGDASVLHEALYAGCSVVSTCPIATQIPDHFFYIRDRDEIVQKIISLLSGENAGYSSVVSNLMDDSAKQLLQLFTDK